MGSTLTFRAWLPELVIPELLELSPLLPSFNFGQETKHSLGNGLGTEFLFLGFSC